MQAFDSNFGIHPVALAVAHHLNSFEPSFAWDTEARDYDIGFRSTPFYNGRERAVAITMQPRRYGGATGFVAVFGENRNSDNIFLDTFEVTNGLNPPTLKDYNDEIYGRRQFFGPHEVTKVTEAVWAHFKECYEEWHRNNAKPTAA